MTQRKTVQKDSPFDHSFDHGGSDSSTGCRFFQPTVRHSYLQGADSFSRPKVWNKTGKDNLVRHKSGRYYARVFGKGKEVWKSLKTSHFSVAQARLAEFLKDHRQRVGSGNGGKDSGISAKMTFGEAAESSSAGSR